MSSNRRLKQSRTRDDEKGARNGPLDREEEQESAGRGAQSGARARCPVVPKIKFATDSSLEGDGFELPVPREMTTIFEPSCFWFL